MLREEFNNDQQTALRALLIYNNENVYRFGGYISDKSNLVNLSKTYHFSISFNSDHKVDTPIHAHQSASMIIHRIQ